MSQLIQVVTQVLFTAPDILELSGMFPLEYQDYSNSLYQSFSTLREKEIHVYTA